MVSDSFLALITFAIGTSAGISAASSVASRAGFRHDEFKFFSRK